MNEQEWAMVDLAGELETARRRNTELCRVLGALVSNEQAFTTTDYIYMGEHITYCNFCGQGDPRQIEHDPGCPIAQARAILAGALFIPAQGREESDDRPRTV